MAQTEALMKGKTREEAEKELRDSGMNEQQIQHIVPHKVGLLFVYRKKNHVAFGNYENLDKMREKIQFCDAKMKTTLLYN